MPKEVFILLMVAMVGTFGLVSAALSAFVKFRLAKGSPRVQDDRLAQLSEQLATLQQSVDATALEVERTLSESAGKLLERLWVFDEYRGRPLADGERSVAWRLVCRANDRTLREEEADKALERAVAAAEQRHGVRRREA